jgi:hypothetical protein
MIKSERMRPALRPRGRHPRWTWWLLVKSGRCRMEVLTLNGAGECTLPAFSGKGEAEMFLLLGKETFEQRWHVRETSAGELVSILYGPCAGVGRVALDPSPEMIGINAVSLVSVTRERFLSWILDSPCSIALGAHHHTRRLVRPL